MEPYRYVVLGGGMVAGYAARAFVEEGLKSGELLIISSDNVLPYERPPLSKGFLAGKDTAEGILINPADFYSSHGIGVRLESIVERVDTDRKRVYLRTGGEIGYEKLLVATGARVRTFELPGAHFDRVMYLRSLDDSGRIRAAAEGARQAVVIGGGFIGMEVSSVLAQKGVATTMVLAEERMWQRVFTPEISDFFRRYYEARGVRLVTGAKVEGFAGEGGRVTSVLLASGRKLPTDLVVAGIGVLPAIEVLEGTGVAVQNGIVVNEYLETNVPGVYAAGDVANYFDVLSGTHRRIEHWDNAVKQGQHAARVLTGARERFENVPYFFSDIFDLSYEFWGDGSGADRVVYRGSLNDTSFSAWWLREGRLVAAFTMNRPDEERETAQEWIRSRRDATALFA